MARAELLSFPIDAPGSKGLNTQMDSTAIDAQFATTATNCVIDESGRLASRKGWQPTHSEALTDSPKVMQVIEYITGSGTDLIIAAAGNKIYEGTEPPTDITGSVSITADNWKFQNFNNLLVGFQSGHEPIVYDGSGTFEYLVDRHSEWASGTSYSEGDTVRPTSHNGFYYECTESGTSDSSEPTWPEEAGDTVTDNTAEWTCREIPKGNEVLSAYGRLWVPDANGNVIYYSDLLIPQNIGSEVGSAGSIDLRSVWVGGMDSVQALGAINGTLVIFGRNSIIIYNGADNIDSISLAEVIRGTGCVARDSVQSIGNDILFLAPDGVRSLGRAVMQETLPMNSLSAAIWNRLSNMMVHEDLDDVRSTYNQLEGFYLLTMPSSGRTICFDLKQYVANGPVRILFWDRINPSALYSGRDDTIYMGQEGYVATYAGYQDNGESYQMSYWSGWTDFAKQYQASSLMNRTLMLKHVRCSLQAAEDFIATTQWNYDYLSDSKTSRFTVKGAGGLAEFGEAEFGEDEFGGGTFTTQFKVPSNGAGRLLRFGVVFPINGTAVKLQRIELFVKVGKLS